MKRVLLLCALVAVVSLPCRAQTELPLEGLLAILPAENLSGASSAREICMKLLTAEVSRRGWALAPAAQVESLLAERRIRYLDSLAGDDRRDLLTKTSAAAVLSATIYSFVEGKRPVVALSARLVRADGVILWADVVALAASDTEGLLGYGLASTAEGLAERAIAQLLADFPRPGARRGVVEGKGAPVFGGKTRSYRSPALATNGALRVCVLPFENMAPSPAGMRIIADLLVLRLAAEKKYEVIDPAELRRAALLTKIGSFRSIGSDALVTLAGEVGTPLFIRGTVFDYRDGSSGDPPRIEVEFSLVDVSKQTVLWSAQLGRTGSDYVGFLMRGAVSTGVKLADRALTEMIATGIPASGATATASQRKTRAVLAERRSRLHRPSPREKNP